MSINDVLRARFDSMSPDEKVLLNRKFSVEKIRPSFEIVYDEHHEFMGVSVKSDKFPFRKMFLAFKVGSFYFGMSTYEAVMAFLASEGGAND